VGLLLCSVRVFKHISWLKIGSGKVALAALTRQQVTRTVGRLAKSIERPDLYVIESNKS
jgi:hypothetical protein